MTEQPTKRRGRAPTGRAMTAAERQRKYLARLKARASASAVTCEDNETLRRQLDEAMRAIAAHERTIRDLQISVRDRDAKISALAKARG